MRFFLFSSRNLVLVLNLLAPSLQGVEIGRGTELGERRGTGISQGVEPCCIYIFTLDRATKSRRRLAKGRRGDGEFAKVRAVVVPAKHFLLTARN